MRIRVDNRGPARRRCTCCRRCGCGTPGRGPARRTVHRDRGHGRRAGGHARCCRWRRAAYGARWLYADAAPELMFTENKTNVERLLGLAAQRPAISRTASTIAIVHGRLVDMSPAGRPGTKAAAHYRSRGAGRRTEWRCGSACPTSGRASCAHAGRSTVRRDVCAPPAARPTSSTRRIIPRILSVECQPRDAPGVLRDCCGRSSSITTW